MPFVINATIDEAPGRAPLSPRPPLSRRLINVEMIWNVSQPQPNLLSGLVKQIPLRRSSDSMVRS